MKPTTLKRVEQGMRYFTPELYLRFNSPDEETADLADEEWGTVAADYRSNLAAIRTQLPFEIRTLAELGLHDAELIAIKEQREPLIQDAMAVLSLRNHESLTTVSYRLWDRISRQRAMRNWPFSKAQVHWLYDEVDLAPGRRPGRFVHRILLSDGRVMVVPFISAIAQTISTTS